VTGSLPGPAAGRKPPYEVHVSRASGAWSAPVIHPREFVVVCLRSASLRDGARRARAWVEAHPLPT
jgi:hypothetical protein